MKKRICILLVLLLVVTTLGACNKTETPTDNPKTSSTDENTTADTTPIKVAVVGPLTGNYAEYGIGFKTASEIMVDKWNKDGGINGRPIELLVHDEKSSTEEGLAIAQLLCGEDNFYGIVGHFSASMAVGGVYTEERIPMISASSSSAGFTGQGDCCFRLNATIETETIGMLDCALSAGKTKLGVVYLNNDWGRGAYKTLQDLLAKRADEGWEVVDAEEIAGGDMDYNAVISNLNAAGAETAIMFCYYDSVVPFTIKARTVMPDLNIICGVNCYNDTFLDVGGKDVEGCLAPSVFAAVSEDPDVKYFVNEYEKRTKQCPSSLTAQAYDAMGVLLTAIAENDGVLDREAIRKSIQNNNYKGVTGSCTFDENRNATRNFHPMVVSDGQWIYYK